MSAILYGNIFEVVAEYEKYVTYSVTDRTLNTWNYEVIFAARGIASTEPDWALQVQPPIQVIPPVPVPPVIVQPPCTSCVLPPPPPPTLVPGEEIIPTPEPGYALLIGLILAVLSLRLRRLAH